MTRTTFRVIIPPPPALRVHHHGDHMICPDWHGAASVRGRSEVWVEDSEQPERAAIEAVDDPRDALPRRTI